MNKRGQAIIIEDGEEIGIGGIVKSSRTKKKDLAFSETISSPHRRITELPAPAAAPPVTLVANQNNEGGKKMATTTTIITTPPRFEICPACGFYSKLANKNTVNERINFLVCKGCNDKYLSYARQIAGELATGQKPKVLSKIEWVATQLDLDRFECELETARKKRADIATRVNEKIQGTVNGKTLPIEVLSELKAMYQKEIADSDYFLVRRLFARLEAAKKLKLELEKKLAEPTQAPPS
ncbi:MAG: hypothetical protein ABH841_01295 [Candidatus Nealsonbacteria bacterium]